MSGQMNSPSAKRLHALLKKLAHDPEATEIVIRLIEKLAIQPGKSRRKIHKK